MVGAATTRRCSCGSGAPSLVTCARFVSTGDALGSDRRPSVAHGYRTNGLRAFEALMLVYEKYVTPQPAQYTPATDQGVICYRRSGNGILNLGVESCSSAITTYYGLTATYDPYTDTYVAGYVANDSLHIGILVVPSHLNSTTPASEKRWPGGLGEAGRRRPTRWARSQPCRGPRAVPEVPFRSRTTSLSGRRAS